MVFDDNIVSFYERQQGAANGQDSIGMKTSVALVKSLWSLSTG